jgi:hypothetical protein
MTPRLIAAIPKLASLDIERSLAFYESLGFTRRGNYPDYGTPNEMASRSTFGSARTLASRKRRPAE